MEPCSQQENSQPVGPFPFPTNATTVALKNNGVRVWGTEANCPPGKSEASTILRSVGIERRNVARLR